MDAFAILYHHHLQAHKVLDHRLHATQKRNASGEDTQEHEQYLPEYEPLIMEKWAIQLLQHNPDIQVTGTAEIARTDFTDASCEVCCDPGTFEDLEEGQPTTDLYQCAVCNRTYHWRCLKQLGCYSEDQRAELDADDNWSCPACKDLNEQEQEDRRNGSNHELVRVTWSPTWEPTELMETWESFKEKVEEYLSMQTPSPADEELDNLERQGFSLDSEASHRWQTTQGHDIRKQAIFDRHPTNPHVDIKGTGSCEIWIREVELVRLQTTPRTETNRDKRIS
jgi:hypothetical protein